MLKYLLLSVFLIYESFAAALFPVSDDEPTPAFLAKHYGHLPYDQRPQIHEICTFFTQCMSENNNLPIIRAAGQQFSDLDGYKSTLGSNEKTGLEALQHNLSIKDLPNWVVTNPFMLFFLGAFSNHIAPDDYSGLAQNLHQQAINLGYKRNIFLRDTRNSGSNTYKNDPRAQQFWELVGKPIETNRLLKNNPYALFILGHCHIDGIGVAQDIKKGLYLLKSSSEQHILPTLRFLKGYLENEDRCFVSELFGCVFAPEYVVKINNCLPLLEDPISHLFGKIESLKKKENCYDQSDLSLMLRSMPGVMIRGEDLIKYQNILERKLKTLFNPGNADFDEVYPLSISFAIGAVISLVKLGLKSDLHSSKLFQAGVLVMIISGWCIACYERHHLPYLFKERKKKYLLTYFKANQRRTAAYLLSYQLITKFRERFKSENELAEGGQNPNEVILADIVKGVNSDLSRVRRKKNNTLFELLSVTSHEDLPTSSRLIQVTSV